MLVQLPVRRTGVVPVKEAVSVTIAASAPTPTPRAVPSDVLRDLLADLIDLSLLAQHAQWNAVGAKADILHRLLESARAAAADHAHAVADRINAVDSCPDGRVHVVAGLSSLPQPKVGRLTDAYIARQFAAIYGKMIRRIRSRGMAVGAADQTTHVLLVQIASELDDHYEVFQSVLRQCGRGRDLAPVPDGRERPLDGHAGGRTDTRAMAEESR